MRRLSLLCVLLAGPAFAQQPVPDPRLADALQRFAISSIHDSGELDGVVPEPLERLPAPEVTEPGMLQLERDIWVDRALVPDSLERPTAVDAGAAVRITPRDAPRLDGPPFGLR